MTNVTPRTIRNVEAELERLRTERDRLDAMLTVCDEARERVIAERDGLRRENAELRKALETFSAEVDRQSRTWNGIDKAG